MASLTIRCGPSHKSRRPRPSTNSLSSYMPETPSHRQVTRVKRTVPANNKFAALAVDTNTKSRRGDRFNGPRPSAAMVAQGSWSKKLTVSLSQAKPEGWRTTVSNKRSVAVKVQPPQEQNTSRPCAYCKAAGCHIRTCDKLAEKNRKRAEWKRKDKVRKADEKKKAAEARLVEMFRIAQQQKQQATVVEESSDSDSSSGEEEDYPALPTVAKAETRRVTFKGDSENLMKPPCKTKVFDKEQPASAISDDDEEDVILLQKAQDIFKPSANAWRPRRRSTGMTTHERQIILDQIKEKEAELASFSTDSWADSAEIEELEDEIENLNAKLLDLA